MFFVSPQLKDLLNLCVFKRKSYCYCTLYHICHLIKIILMQFFTLFSVFFPTVFKVVVVVVVVSIIDLRKVLSLV